jgi:predicted type IV restriction endonuclease
MTELLRTLQQVKQRVDRYSTNGINEQDTKATLVQPVLRSLGWDVEDLEDVQREYKIRKQDKPVDFALFLLRSP